VALNPEVIFTNTTPAIKALQQETDTIPLIFVEVSDPIGAGVVASLARPGGNISGFLFYEDSILGKWLGMLKEIAPHLTRAALLGNPKGFPYGYFLRTAKVIAPSLGMEVVPAPVANADKIEQAIESFARVPNGGLLAPNDSTVEANRDLVIALAARHRLPAVYAFRDFVTAGGLMYYGTDLIAQFRRAASYIDRVLHGANPADLPVEAPTKYETVLNLRTAKALGFQVPSTLLVRADEVIE
jgi:putative ABC transport system substrate-binding protein